MRSDVIFVFISLFITISIISILIGRLIEDLQKRVKKLEKTNEQ
jgi:hypothetical protein